MYIWCITHYTTKFVYQKYTQHFKSLLMLHGAVHGSTHAHIHRTNTGAHRLVCKHLNKQLMEINNKLGNIKTKINYNTFVQNIYTCIACIRVCIRYMQYSIPIDLHNTCTRRILFLRGLLFISFSFSLIFFFPLCI